MLSDLYKESQDIEMMDQILNQVVPNSIDDYSQESSVLPEGGEDINIGDVPDSVADNTAGIT